MNTPLPPSEAATIAHSMRSANIEDKTLYPSDRLREFLELMLANRSQGGAMSEAAELIRSELALRRASNE